MQGTIQQQIGTKEKVGAESSVGSSKKSRAGSLADVRELSAETM